MNTSTKVLMIGYGNPGRLDDGLGPLLIEKLQKAGLDNLSLDSDYQLTVEDAAQFKDYEVIIFADADVNGPEPFHFTRLIPTEEVSFTTHSVLPEVLLGMSKKLFGKEVEGYALGIRGYEFDDFGEWLSEGAKKNLGAAYDFTIQLVKDGDFQAAEAKHGKHS